MPSDRNLVPAIATLLAAASLALVTGCKNKTDGIWSQTTLTQATVPVQQVPVAAAQPPAAQAALPRGEQHLETPPVKPPPAPPPADPALDVKNRKTARAVRTPSDENLPKWVPVRGRLSVVESSDLAENLGLVPVGTTKKSDERISVSDKLAEESAARKASQPDQITQGVSWNYAGAGRFRGRR
jgi:hypothetical protein